jgi:hypothetical protein
MMEPFGRSLRVSFENGDSISIKCPMPEEICIVRIVVNSLELELTDEQLDGFEPLPSQANLYSGLGSEREEWFSFEVSVRCPATEERANHECSVGGVYKDGVLSDVDLRIRANQHVRQDI